MCCRSRGSRSCSPVSRRYTRPGARRVCCPPSRCATTEARHDEGLQRMVISQELVLEGAGLVKEFVQGAITLRVLDGASISVRAGERIAIVGASGSGKTPLLRVLGGPDSP